MPFVPDTFFCSPVSGPPDQANIGLYGSAPIMYQTNVAMTAENDSYTGIDFTADGYDPYGEALTPVIVQAPTYGSLTYNTSTGLYDYTAQTGYTGEDSFQFELSNGHAVSNVVTVQILAYNGIIPLGTYDSFPAMSTDLFVGGAPSQSSIQQGKIADCWFVGAAAGLAQQKPNQLVNMIQYNANFDFYEVTFPGQKPTSIAGFEHDGHNYSTANGDWLAVLEKAYGQMIYNQKVFTWGNTPYDYINRGNPDSTGIEALTGHNTDTDDFWATRDSMTRTKLINALANNKVVTTGTAGSSLSDAKLEAIGLAPHHTYTVLAYDSTRDEVRLRNAWGKDLPLYNNGTDPRFYRGKDQADGGGGNFWMSLSEFTKTFGNIDYEQ